jgi:predicted  nucleic acid-binding Zn-ribbon protein
MKTEEKKLLERKTSINNRISTSKRAFSDLTKKIATLEQELTDLENFQESQQPDIAELEENMKVIIPFCSLSRFHSIFLFSTSG